MFQRLPKQKYINIERNQRMARLKLKYTSDARFVNFCVALYAVYLFNLHNEFQVASTYDTNVE